VVIEQIYSCLQPTISVYSGTAGVASMSNMTSGITTGAVSPSDPVENVMLKFETVSPVHSLLIIGQI